MLSSLMRSSVARSGGALPKMVTVGRGAQVHHAAASTTSQFSRSSLVGTPCTITNNGRFKYFSTVGTAGQLPPDDPQAQFQPTPPTSLNLEMAQGIQNANQLILKHGVGKQRLTLLSQDDNMPLVLKWQRMMEIYLGAQLHVIASLGYETNEQGIMHYTQQLGQFIASCEPEQQEEFRMHGRTTWREMLVAAFDLDRNDIAERDEMTIVDARNTVHKVASRLIEPAILEMVAQRVADLPPQSDQQMEMGLKHGIIQDVVVNHVYLGGDPPLVEELGFGSGPKGYALMQYVMAYHENDPLCMQYTSSSMVKIWKAAGLDLSNVNPAAVAKMPMSAPN